MFTWIPNSTIKELRNWPSLCKRWAWRDRACASSIASVPTISNDFQRFSTCIIYIYYIFYSYWPDGIEQCRPSRAILVISMWLPKMVWADSTIFIWAITCMIKLIKRYQSSFFNCELNLNALMQPSPQLSTGRRAQDIPGGLWRLQHRSGIGCCPDWPPCRVWAVARLVINSCQTSEGIDDHTPDIILVLLTPPNTTSKPCRTVAIYCECSWLILVEPLFLVTQFDAEFGYQVTTTRPSSVNDQHQPSSMITNIHHNPKPSSIEVRMPSNIINHQPATINVNDQHQAWILLCGCFSK